MKISILIPCHNEEKSIEKCVISLLRQSRPADQIIVVDDASTDDSVKILEKFGGKITLLKLEKNTGNKSYVQQYGLAFITGDIFIATDADTILDKNFVARMEADFSDQLVVAACGYIKSFKDNWLTAVRELYYIIDLEINKVAQSHINFLYVIPGCASAFRTEFFRHHIRFDHDTITEDLDFSYQINKQKLRIFYDKKAIVYTQDPADISSYINQIRRWFGGGMQNLAKHFAIMNHPASALELSMIYIEGLVFAFVLFVLPFLNLVLFSYVILSYSLVYILVGLVGSIMRRRLDLLIYSPMCLFMLYVNSYVFLEQLVLELVLKKHNLVWFSPPRKKIL